MIIWRAERILKSQERVKRRENIFEWIDPFLKTKFNPQPYIKVIVCWISKYFYLYNLGNCAIGQGGVGGWLISVCNITLEKKSMYKPIYKLSVFCYFSWKSDLKKGLVQYIYYHYLNYLVGIEEVSTEAAQTFIHP